jgi:hypothetical protein
MLLLSSLLLLVAGVPATACIPASAGISAVADFPLVPDVRAMAFVVDTGGKFAAGIVDTVSTILAKLVEK